MAGYAERRVAVDASDGACMRIRLLSDDRQRIPNRALRAGMEMPVARATGWDRKEVLSFEPRGLAAPAGIMPPLRGW
jgi:hypothetical protein